MSALESQNLWQLTTASRSGGRRGVRNVDILARPEPLRPYIYLVGRSRGPTDLEPWGQETYER